MKAKIIINKSMKKGLSLSLLMKLLILTCLMSLLVAEECPCGRRLGNKCDCEKETGFLQTESKVGRVKIVHHDNSGNKNQLNTKSESGMGMIQKDVVTTTSKGNKVFTFGSSNAMSSPKIAALLKSTSLIQLKEALKDQNRPLVRNEIAINNPIADQPYPNNKGSYLGNEDNSPEEDVEDANPPENNDE